MMVLSDVSGKSMRPLIADEDVEQRRFVEKSFTTLGYFRTVTAGCFDEMISLTHYSPVLFDRFDLLVVNSDIFYSCEFDYLDFCLGNSRLKHVLIYDLNKGSSAVEVLSERSGEQVWRVQNVTSDVIARLIPLIDSRAF
ncbi:hypothetical protein [Pseudomonas sp. HS6]|uniref:hypothetical protein n=1 Tax=Pseudomonas sp. HS6 TaxID=2850559 RepID=UPI0020197655|nr:hypothetical protein [Pseudomonas sp. HS6]UQS17572.1 hypothetical protein JJN09_12145 [Pseudomonas sp. HS6]